MRLVDIRDITVPLSGNISNAVVSFRDHTVSLIALVSDRMHNGRPVIGFGFNSIGRYGQSGILRERMIPRLRASDPDALLDASGRFDPARIAAVAMRNEKPGGHGDRAGALAALELAVWDLNAKLNDEPAWALIARTCGHRVEDRSAPVYAAGGYYYPANADRSLSDELAAYRDAGFDAFKIKVGGAPLSEDMARIDAALALAGHGSRLAVDANGRFDLAAASAFAESIRGYGLRWFEEPGDPLDYALNAALISRYDGAVATGENLFSARDVDNLVRYAGMRTGRDVFQMDAGLSYGLTEYASMIAALETHGFSRQQCFPHGGHLINLHIVIGMGLGGCEAYPGVFQPFGGYSADCRIDEGRVWAGQAPGFGLEQKAELRGWLEQLSGG